MKRANLFSFLFGDDVFISYARKDGRSYARRLAKLLGDVKFDVFYDQLGTPRGDEVPQSVLDGCGRARLLVVVETPEAKTSPAVRKELAAFPCDRRPMLLIESGANVTSADWKQATAGVARLTESPEAFERGDCSAHVVEQVRDAATFVRRRTVWFAASILFVTLVVVSTAIALFETRQFVATQARLQTVAQQFVGTQRELARGKADLKEVKARIVEAQATAALENANVPGNELKTLEMALRSANDSEALGMSVPPIVHSALAAGVVMAQRAVTLRENANDAASLTFSSDGKRLIVHSFYHDASAWALDQDENRNWHFAAMPIVARLAVLQQDVDTRARQLPLQRTLKDEVEEGAEVWKLSAESDWALSPARAVGTTVRYALWATGSGQYVASIESKGGFVQAPAFSVQGSRLYYVDHNGRGHVLDLHAPDLKREIWASAVERWGFGVSPTGKRVLNEPGLLIRPEAAEIRCRGLEPRSSEAPATANADGGHFLTDDLVELWTVDPETTRVWNCETGHQTTLDHVTRDKAGLEREERLYFVVGKYLVAVGQLASEQKTRSVGYLTVWELGDGRLHFRQQFPLQPESLRSEHLIYAQTGILHAVGIEPTLAAVWGGDALVRLFDLSAGRLTDSLAGHHGVVLAVARSPDGEHLASAASDGKVRLWHLRDGTRLARHAVPIREHHDNDSTHECLEAGGERLAVMGHSGLEFWQVAGSSPARTVPFKAFASRLKRDLMSEDTHFFLFCSAYEIYAESKRFNFSGDVMPESKDRKNPNWPEEFSIDGDLKVQVKSTSGGLVELTATSHEGKLVAKWQLEAYGEISAPVAISAQHNRIAVATGNGSLHILDAKSLREVIPAIETPDGVDYAEFSPDGRWILTVETYGLRREGAKVWDVASGRRVFNIAALGTNVTGATFSKDGSAIIYLCADGDVRKIWVSFDRLKSAASAMLRQ